MRATTTEFILKAKLQHGDKYDYSESEYINNRTKVRIICPNHGPFYQNPQNHYKNGHGCPRCGQENGYARMRASLEEFISKFKELYPNEDLIEPKTFSDNFKFSFICHKHGKFTSTPKHILTSWNCPECTTRKISERNLSKLREMYPHLDYTDSKYTDRESYISVYCTKHLQYFTVHFGRHTKGQIGCPGCKTDKITATTTQSTVELNRIKLFNELFPKYEYVSYKDGMVNYICPNHGLVSSRWCNARKGKGCKLCAETKFAETYKLQESEILHRFNKTHGHQYDYSEIAYKSLHEHVNIICKEHGEFRQTPNNHINGSGCPKCNISYQHKTILSWLEQHQITYIVNDRKIIAPLELDIVCPDHKIAIEINGLYWHSFGLGDVIDKNRHRNKLQACVDNGFRLLQFTDSEITTKPDIVRSMILNKLGYSRRLYARNFEFRTIPRDLAKLFLARNHLKSSGSCSICYGLIDGSGDLKSVMTFTGKNNDYKIDRYATEVGLNIVGGGSKLFNNFIRRHTPSRVVTYADLRYADGGVYRKFGMRFDGVTQVDYCYTKNSRVYSRQKFQKHKLSNLLESFDPDMTEIENMLRNGYRILYGCGNTKFTWIGSNLCQP